VAFVGISVDDKLEFARKFLTFFPVTYLTAHDLGGGTVADRWGVSSLPMTFVIDKSGVVRRRHLGYTPQLLRQTLSEVDALLAE